VVNRDVVKIPSNKAVNESANHSQEFKAKCNGSKPKLIFSLFMSYCLSFFGIVLDWIRLDLIRAILNV